MVRIYDSTKIFKIIVFVVVVGAAGFLATTALLTVSKQTSRSQIAALDKASEDLHQLYTQLINDLQVDTKTTSFTKRCGQSSAKFHSGTITCGPRGEFMQDVDYESVRAGSYTETIKNTQKFIHVEVDNFDSGGEIWTRLSFLHKETDTVCFLNFIKNGSATKYTLGCNMTVPSFISGYTVEK